MSEGKRDVQISKSLAYLLRHGALKEKLPIDPNGYIPISVLLQHNRLKSLHCTQQDVDRVVANNAKKRFHIKTEDNNVLICATQGHSIAAVAPAGDVLQPITADDKLPEKLVHGTNLKNCKLIIESGGIRKMRRNHVHLAAGITGLDGEVVSGTRTSSNVFIFLKRELAFQQLRLFKSLNDVYLTADDVPTELFEKVLLRTRSANKKGISELVLLLESKGIPVELQ
ncbi:tRNA 2'-phosphotransferase [Lachancea thermotolerans CBS 6340]|uniref:2'-phosphotransferase n=1 Tax=Lachancea thermotolerans (strain ATCC 56472 / CBS 6340 / NRRL Y-8284) TaxID=559295 RepID=C5DEI3_LACTC|nr:KLTH0C09460p [Lachancea thermotolerans CBS 6340]CAR22194.1 KLTH0C09460p [Lachancea thermotolerans CBS 6340]